MDTITFVRLLRTSGSERYLLRQGQQVIAALELHYLPKGEVDGTLIVLEDAHIPEDRIPALLMQIDEQLLPDVAMKDQNLFFTVVIGKVLGGFEPHAGTREE